jgi:NAD(P)-dependent dehydrogenase (short-subunit alcohol dehydrogenase family)
MRPTFFMETEMVRLMERREILLRQMPKNTRNCPEMRGRALVIGASGGIGGALSSELVAAGNEVVEISRSKDGFDVTDPGSVANNLASISGTFDRILVATGILAPSAKRPEKSLSEIEAEDMARVFAVNAIGPALVLRHIPSLLPLKERAVVGVLTARVGSIGDNGFGGWYSYRASKAAANQIVRTAAIEIARKRKNAIVVALHPGTVATSFTDSYPNHSKVSPEAAAKNILAVLDGLESSDTGNFFDWAARPVPW